MKTPHEEKTKLIAKEFMRESMRTHYSYNFSWLDRPIIQYPQDIIATQELIWSVKPDIIIETGIAHGGSLIFSASMLALLDHSDAFENKLPIDPQKPKRKVVGVDIDIRNHNREALDLHFLRNRLELIQGSSIDPLIVKKVKSHLRSSDKVMVFLDSNHSHSHVLAELEAYTPLVSKGSYCIVFDTVAEELPEEITANRPWGVGDSPMTAVKAFLNKNKDFVINKEIESKLLITVSPDGYLKKI